MKSMNIKKLFWWCICGLLLPLQACNDIDELQSEANLLKDRVAALETAVKQMNESVNSLQHLLSGKQIVGITAIDKGYKVELNDGQSFNVVNGEEVNAGLPLLTIGSDGCWQYKLNPDGPYLPMVDKDGKPVKAYPINDQGTPIESPQVRVSNDGYWQVSYDGGKTFDYLMENGKKMRALFNSSSNSVFSAATFDPDKQELTVTLSADNQAFTFPVITTFYLTVKGAETEQVFPLSDTRIYEVEQNEVANAIIQAPEGWKVTLSETELKITAPSQTDAEKQEKINILITSPKQYIRIVTMDVKLLTTKFDASFCTAWNEFVNKDPKNVLLDFSYAGYKHGEVAPPDVSTLSYKTYNIADYGAIPNDGISDRAAFIALLEAMGATRGADTDAIRYQMNSANAIIYFPEGEYILQGVGENNKPLRLTMNNLVIKGAGRDKTTIRMASANELARPDEMWSAPVMLELKNNGGLTELTTVSADAPKGSFSIAVASTTGIKVGDWVCLLLVDNSAELIAKELSPYPVEQTMTNLNEVGVQVYDYHQVKSISGSTLTFVEPLMHEVEAKYKWTVQKYPHYENIGVEDLAFAGDAKTDFGHHASGADDGAYKLIDFVRLTNSWMRRVNFTSVSEASSIVNCANVSVYDVHIGGKRGHAAIRSQASSRVFIGKVTDESDDTQNGVTTTGAGQYHACGVSKQSLGAVIWNAQWGTDACFESHATQPRATLVDRCSGGFMSGRFGGDENQLPNHLADLTIWNMNATAVAGNGQFDWWGSTKWGLKMLPPTIVGFHGQNISFNAAQMKRNDSPGTVVEPYSLYEAQLHARLGYVPAWLNSLK